MNFQLPNSVEHQQLIREEDNHISVCTLCLEHIMPHYRFLSLPSHTIIYCRDTSFKSVVFVSKCLDRLWRKKVLRVVDWVTDDGKNNVYVSYVCHVTSAWTNSQEMQKKPNNNHLLASWHKNSSTLFEIHYVLLIICMSILCIPLGICFHSLIKGYFFIYIKKKIKRVIILAQPFSRHGILRLFVFLGCL